MKTILNTVNPAAIIARVKLLLLSPKEAWQTISQEQDTPIQILTKFLVPLTCASIVATVVGLQVFGQNVPGFGVWRPGFFSLLINQTLIAATIIAVFFLDALVIEKLAAHFKKTISYDKAFSVVAYSSLPGFLVRLLGIFPPLSTTVILGFAAVVCSTVLFFNGLDTLAQSEAATSHSSRYSFFGTSLVAVILLTSIAYSIVPAIGPTPFLDVGRLN